MVWYRYIQDLLKSTLCGFMYWFIISSIYISAYDECFTRLPNVLNGLIYFFIFINYFPFSSTHRMICSFPGRGFVQVFLFAHRCSFLMFVPKYSTNERYLLIELFIPLTIVWSKISVWLQFLSFTLKSYFYIQILTTVYQILVKITALVQTWLMITSVIVWWDSMGKIVKTVNYLNTY